MSKIIAAAVAGAALSMAASTATAGTLTNVSMTLSNTAPSQPTDVNIQFTTASPLDGSGMQNNLFYARLDNGLAVNNATDLCSSTITVTVDDSPLPGTYFQCQTFAPDGIQISLPGNQTVAANSVIKIKIDKTLVTTSATPGTYTPSVFRTMNSIGIPIDAPQTIPSYTITSAPPPAPIPTLTEWAMILLTVALGGFAALTINKRRRTV
jgi:hypothetical protein